MTHWNRERQCEIEDPAVDAFIEDLVEVCKKHRMSLSHEDRHGAFVVEMLDESNLDWLKSAFIGDIERNQTAQ